MAFVFEPLEDFIRFDQLYKKGSVDDEGKKFMVFCSSAGSPSLDYEETAGFRDWQQMDRRNPGMMLNHSLLS